MYTVDGCFVEGRFVEGRFVKGRLVEGRFVEGRSWKDVLQEGRFVVKDVLWKDVLY